MKKLLPALLVIVALSSSCTHENGIILAGKGGSATVVVYPRHHGRTINLDSCIVYVRYNSLDAPADGVYDDSLACAHADSLSYCSFSGLKNGNYYFYAKGYDYSISEKVKGGFPYTITSQASQNLDLPVTE